MIEVAKIVTRRERQSLSTNSVFDRHGLDSPYIETHRDVEWIEIEMDEKGITLTGVEVSRSGIPSRTGIKILNPDVAIELAQVLMKAAESQVEYAAASNALAAQRAKLDDTFKDRISGLGLKQPDKAQMLRVVSGDEVIEA